MGVDAAAIAAARAAVTDVVRHTPVLPSMTLSDACGGTVLLKAENLQRTGSFKIRGALNKVSRLDDGAAGVVTGSAGNHAQALAAAARARRVPCEVFMPAQAPIAKAEGAAALGARVRLESDDLEDCLRLARERADAGGLVFVHPFDDPDVVAGQGTLGLELLDDVDDLALAVVPVGGGGLAAGVAIAVKAARPQTRVVGVRVADARLTIADGIAVKRPGDITGPLLDRWLDEVVTVDEDAIAEAMVLLMEKAKLVVEGAGAVGVAALVGGQIAAPGAGATVVVLSGGNVDAGLLATVARHHETEVGRRLVFITRVPDRPGSLAGLLQVVAGAGANLLEVSHVREGVELHVRETAVQLVLETRGRDHAESVLRAVAAAGYPSAVLG